MRSACVVASIVVALLTPGLTSAQEDPSIDTTELAPGLHRLTYDAGNFTVNMIVSIGEDGTLLVDTGFDFTANALRETLKKLGGADPEIIINTHAHVDHTGSNAVFEDAPVIIAHDVVRTRLQGGEYSLDDFPDAMLPDVTFKDRMTVHFNGDVIEIIAVPGAHDDNDAIVHFTRAGVVALGDLSYGMRFPSVDEVTGDVLQYAEVARRVIDLLPEDVTLVSGHGRDLSMDEYHGFQKMLAGTTEAVGRMIADGKDLEAMRAAGILEKWETPFGEGYVSTDRWIEYLADGHRNPGPKQSLIEAMAPALENGDVDAAIATYRALKTERYDDYLFKADNHYFFGSYLLGAGDPDGAARFFTLSLEEFPDWEFNATMHFLLGETHRKRGDTEGAAAEYRKALAINPEQRRAAAALKDLGRKD